MSFAAQTKKELTMVEAEPCCDRAELSALVQMNGQLQTVKKRHHLDISTQNAAIARRIYILLKRQCHDLHTEIIVRKQMRLKKNNAYIIRLNDQAQIDRLLRHLYIDEQGAAGSADDSTGEQPKLSFHIAPKLVAKNCCKRAYLRGAFLAGGSVNNPEGSSYHLEIATVDEAHSLALCELANHFELNARSFERKRGYILYLKEGEKIIEFLNLIGAYQALFKFEDVRIMRDMRNSVNRIVNCETANLNKTINAAVRQIENIKLISEEIGLDNLPEKLREVAIVRLQHPDLNLKEVGALLKGKVSKSGVNHRLRKIEQIANEIRNPQILKL